MDLIPFFKDTTKNASTQGFADNKKPDTNCIGFLELMVRIELTTCSLRVNCSAIEPHQHIGFCNVDYYTEFSP